jgi:hypothetical protein
VLAKNNFSNKTANTVGVKRYGKHWLLGIMMGLKKTPYFV